MSQLLHQTLNHGSAYHALLAEKIQLPEIYQYLLAHPVSLSTMITYRNVCRLIQEGKLKGQHRTNGKLFILETSAMEYVGIFLLTLMPKTETRDEIDELTEQEKLQLFEKQRQFYAQLASRDAQSQNIHYLCDTGYPSENLIFTEDELACIFGGHSNKYIGQVAMTRANMIEYALKYDYYEVLETLSYDQYFDKLLIHCENLRKCAPEYWLAVGQDVYQTYVQKHIGQLKWGDIKSHQTCFPDLIETLTADGLDFFLIQNLKPLTQAYILGFPIHIYEPSPQEMKDRLQSFKNTEVFFIDRKTEVINWLKQQQDLIHPDGIVTNTANMYGDEITAFNPFDILIYFQDRHITYFTRAEFDYLIKNKKNPWTNLPLPAYISSKLPNVLNMPIFKICPHQNHLTSS